jgi:hypothetical protein
VFALDSAMSLYELVRQENSGRLSAYWFVMMIALALGPALFSARPLKRVWRSGDGRINGTRSCRMLDTGLGSSSVKARYGREVAKRATLWTWASS